MLKLLVLPIILLFHPVHVTLTTIEQGQGSDSIKVFFRMYYDDYLRDYKTFDPGRNLESITDNQSFPVDLAGKYFNNRIHIYIDNKILKGKVLSVTILDNEIFMNVLYKSVKDPSKIKIRNRVLNRLYSDQTNMVFIKIKKYEEALRLTPGHEMESRSFNN